MDKRLFVGGLVDAAISSADIEARLSPFVDRVKSVDIIRYSDGRPKGFAYVDCECSDVQFKKCSSVYNGSQWRGGSLSIQEARPSFLQRLREEHDPPVPAVIESKEGGDEKPAKVKRVWKAVELDADMTPVTGRNCKNRKHWKRLSSGKPVRSMRIRFPGATRVSIVDPAKYMGNFIKFKHEASSVSSGASVEKGFKLARLPAVVVEEDPIVSKIGDDTVPMEDISIEEEKSKSLSILEKMLGSIGGPVLKPKPAVDIEVDAVEEENKRMKSLFFGDKYEKTEPTTNADASGFSFGFVQKEEAVADTPKEDDLPALRKTDVFVEDIFKSQDMPFLFLHQSSDPQIIRRSSYYQESEELKHLPADDALNIWKQMHETLTQDFKKQNKNSQRLSQKYATVSHSRVHSK